MESVHLSGHGSWGSLSSPSGGTTDMGHEYHPINPSPASDVWWTAPATCSNFFTSGAHPCCQCKQAVRILLSRNCPFERINSLQWCELTRRYSHLLFTQISPLTYAVYLWPVHCECAMKHNRRRIFNYLQIRDTNALMFIISKIDFFTRPL